MCFGAINEKTSIGTVNKGPINKVVETVKSKAFMISSIVFDMGPSSCNLPSHLVTMKLIAILIILYLSAHRKNSNYILFFIGLYFYFTDAKTDAITFFNYFDLSVLYDILQKKLKNIISMSKNWIKQ